MYRLFITTYFGTCDLQYHVSFFAVNALHCILHIVTWLRRWFTEKCGSMQWAHVSTSKPPGLGLVHVISVVDLMPEAVIPMMQTVSSADSPSTHRASSPSLRTAVLPELPGFSSWLTFSDSLELNHHFSRWRREKLTQSLLCGGCAVSLTRWTSKNKEVYKCL